MVHVDRNMKEQSWDILTVYYNILCVIKGAFVGDDNLSFLQSYLSGPTARNIWGTKTFSETLYVMTMEKVLIHATDKTPQ